MWHMGILVPHWGSISLPALEAYGVLTSRLSGKSPSGSFSNITLWSHKQYEVVQPQAPLSPLELHPLLTKNPCLVLWVEFCPPLKDECESEQTPVTVKDRESWRAESTWLWRVRCDSATEQQQQ